MAEESVPQTQTEGVNEMAKKEMKGRKRKDDAAPAKKAAAKKEPKQPKEPKAPRAPRAKKAALKVNAPKGINVKEAAYVTIAATEDKSKKLWIRGSTVGLTEKVTGLKGFKPVTEDDAKKNHLGKTRMLGKVESQEDLDDVVKKFFA
jgi:hypothetical protein